MTTETMQEPIRLSPRFRSAIETRILELERNAARDERMLTDLKNADHRRRQQMLVDKQLEKAFRLREMLEHVWARSAATRRGQAA